MNQEPIELPYELDVQGVLAGLRKVEQGFLEHKSTITALGQTDPFGALANNMNRYNQTLADGTKIYTTIEQSAEGYKNEIKRLIILEKELVQQQAKFVNAANYDATRRQLEQLRERIKEVKAGLKGLGEESEKAGKKTKQAFNIFDFLKSSKVGTALAGYFAIDKLIQFEGKIIDVTAAYEKYKAVLTNGLRSEQLAADALNMLSDLAIKTPFQITELTEAYIKYVNRGIIPTREELIKLGDIASNSGKSFDQLTEAVLDAVVGENERLKEFGIKARVMGDNVTYSFRGIEKTVKKTDQEAIKQAIISFGELNGVAGAMSAIMGTLGGMISNVKDSWEQFLRNLGEQQGGALYNAVSLLGKFVGWLRDITQTTAEEKLRQEQAEFNALAGAILQTNDKSEIRNKLYAELLQKYPSILGFLGDEVASNEALARVLNFVNERYETKIKLAAQDVLAKRNAEEVANAYERQRDGLKLLTDAYSDYLKSQGKSQSQITKDIQNFREIDDKERAKILANIKEKQKALAAGAYMDANQIVTPEALNATQTIAAIDNLNKAEKRYQDALKDGVELQKEAARIQAADTKAREENIKKAEQQITVLKARNNLSKEETQRLKELENFVKGAETYGQNPITPKAKPPTSKGELNEKARQQLQARKEMLDLEKRAQELEARLSQIQLDGQNIRLSLLRKYSDEYLDEKRKYDYALLNSEREAQLKLYAEQNSVRVQFKDAAGKTHVERQDAITYRTNQLVSQGNNRDEARKQARDELAKQFEKDPNTKPIRDLISSKAQLIEVNLDEERTSLIRQTTAQLLGVLGEGFEVEKQRITEHYKELFSLYAGNAALLGQLRVAKEKDIATALLANQQQEADKELEQRKTLIELGAPNAGDTELEAERKKQKALLDAEKEYYQTSLNLLTEYLTSAAYMTALLNGQITTEQKAEYERRVALLQAQLKASNKAIENFTSTSGALAPKFKDLWEVAGKAFGQLTGKASNFFNDAANAQLREALTGTFNSVKQAMLDYLNTEIEQSKERLSIFENEISTKEQLLDDENEKRKQGLANNYDALKADVERSKKARDDEKDHLKKVQKEKAYIESLEIASANAVTVANLVASMAEVTKGFSTIPIVGVVLAIAAMATLFSAFTSIKGKINQATKLRKGQRLEGPSHERGGMDIVNPFTGEALYNVEGREWLIGSDPSERHNELLGHINADTFKQLDQQEQQRLLQPLGLKLSQNLNADIDRTANMYTTALTIQQQTDRDVSSRLARLGDILGSIETHTSRINGTSREYIGKGKFAIYKGEKLIGIEENPFFVE